MTIEELKKLFPLEGKLTMDILDRANIHNPYNCPGVLTLKEALATKGVTDG